MYFKVVFLLALISFLVGLNKIHLRGHLYLLWAPF